MATFLGNSAGYQIDFLGNGKIRVVDIDLSDGDTGKQLLVGDQLLSFADKSYQLEILAEERVNTTIAGTQINSDITTLDDGSYIIAWYDGGNAGAGIYTQRYDAAGNKIGGETSAVASLGAYVHKVAGLPDGGYVIVWDRGEWNDISLQRFDASGNKVGDEIRVNSTEASGQFDPDVAVLDDGGYVVSWTSWHEGNWTGIYAQRYDASGNTVGGEIHVNAITKGLQESPAITALNDGGYLITWVSLEKNICAQRYDEAGAAVGDQTRVNTSDGEFRIDPAVTVLSDGGYVISWWERFLGGSDRVYFQRYDATGDAVGGETRVGDVSDDLQFEPAITALANGGFVLTWDGADGISAQLYDAAGNAVGGELRVSATPGESARSEVTALEDGGFAITWTNWNTDGDEISVYTRRFDANGESEGTSLRLTGTAEDDVINGGYGAQYIDGKEGNDTLNGGAGDDELYGGSGRDTLNGGMGNDKLLVSPYSGDGTALNGGAGADVLLGGCGDDELQGGSGNDVLDAGMGGYDVLNGGAGKDLLTTALHYGGKVIMNGGVGNDTLDAADARGNAVLLGGTGNDTLIAAEDSHSRLDGGLGNDMLIANGEEYGGVTLRFSTLLDPGHNVDTVVGFSAADKIELSVDIFAALAASVGGGLDAANFRASTSGNAADGDDYILYETDTGKLFYDADGNGAGVKTLFAVIGIDDHTALAAENFKVI